MTQTIKHCNEILAGKIYPVEHLRTAESIAQLCEYVDAGNPIATANGEKIYYFRLKNDKFVYDYQSSAHGEWVDGYHFEGVVLDLVKLAPLTYRNGRPLHVGDEIVVRILGTRWDKTTMTVVLLEDLKTMQWRFANEDLLR